MYVLIYGICFSLPDLLHSVLLLIFWKTLLDLTCILWDSIISKANAPSLLWLLCEHSSYHCWVATETWIGLPSAICFSRIFLLHFPLALPSSKQDSKWNLVQLIRTCADHHEFLKRLAESHTRTHSLSDCGTFCRFSFVKVLTDLLGTLLLLFAFQLKAVQLSLFQYGTES